MIVKLVLKVVEVNNVLARYSNQKFIEYLGVQLTWWNLGRSDGIVNGATRYL